MLESREDEAIPMGDDPNDPTRVAVAREAEALPLKPLLMALVIPGVTAGVAYGLGQWLFPGEDQETIRQVMVVSGLVAAAGAVAWMFTRKR
ncbi:MAG: hypothetical protein ACE366_12310 [Bradymonadia bacterium]